MTEISERYKIQADQFEAKLSAVPDNAWEQQSPCPEWNTRDVVRHVVESSGHFLGMVNQQPELPSVDEDPMQAFRALRSIVEEDLEQPSIARTEIDSGAGMSTFEELVDRYLCTDLVVHAWDLSRAAGIDDTLDIESVRSAKEKAVDLAEMGRQMGAFGPAIDVTDSANEQTQLIAMLGRNPQ